MFPVCVMSAVIARLTHCPTGINFFAENCRAVDSIVVLLEAIILSSVSMILVLRCQLCFQTPARLPKLILWIAWATVTAVWLANPLRHFSLRASGELDLQVATHLRSPERRAQ